MENWMKGKIGRESWFPQKKRLLQKSKAHSGKPIQLFKDSDKDGVPNVFDCTPYNKKKQEVMIPQNYGGGMNEMYGRQEGYRQQKEYEREIARIQKLNEQRAKEMQKAARRSSGGGGFDWDEYKGQPGSSMTGRVTFNGQQAEGTGTAEDPFRAPSKNTSTTTNVVYLGKGKDREKTNPVTIK